MLPANEKDEREPDQQEEQAGEPVQETDDLVIGRVNPAEHVPASYLRRSCDRKRSRRRRNGDRGRLVYIFRRSKWHGSHGEAGLQTRLAFERGVETDACPSGSSCSVGGLRDGGRHALGLRWRRADASRASARHRPGTRGGPGDVAGRARQDAGHRRRLPRLPHPEEGGAGRPRGRHGSDADRVIPRARACRRHSSRSRAAPT